MRKSARFIAPINSLPAVTSLDAVLRISFYSFSPVFAKTRSFSGKGGEDDVRQFLSSANLQFVSF